MSIFGDLDVSNIPDDPFYTAPNTYWALCTEAKVVEKDGNTSFVIVWQIDEPDSEFNGNQLREYYKLFPGRVWDELDSDEKKVMKFLKKRLRTAFDLTDEQQKTVSPSELVGLGAFITTVVNEGKGANTGKKFTNVSDTKSKRLMDEEQSGTVPGLGI